MKVQVLYVEDNLIDKRNMEWVCSNFSNIALTITDDLDQLPDLLKEISFDIIFTDRRIGSANFAGIVPLWGKTPYYVLSNSIYLEKGLEPQPISYLQKPLIQSTFESIINKGVVPLNDPNLDYFEQFPNEEFKVKMKELLKEELENALVKIPEAQKNDSSELILLIHNLAGSFSILSMKDSFAICKETEKRLRANENADELIVEILSNVKHSIQFVTLHQPN